MSLRFIIGERFAFDSVLGSVFNKKIVHVDEGVFLLVDYGIGVEAIVAKLLWWVVLKRLGNRCACLSLEMVMVRLYWRRLFIDHGYCLRRV